MWNWRASETFADTTLMAAESSGSWSLEIGCRCRRAESSTRSRNPLPGRKIREWSEHVGQRWLQQSQQQQ